MSTIARPGNDISDGVKPFRYWIWVRLSDALNGWWDGVKRQPAHANGGQGEVRTTYWHRLDARARALYGREQEELERELAPKFTRTEQLWIELEYAKKDLPAAEKRLAECRAAHEKLLAERDKRLTAGTPETDDQRIRTWERGRELTRAIETAQRRVTDLSEKSRRWELEISALLQDIDFRIRLGNTRVRRAAHLMDARQARYRRSLVDSHPHGEAVGQVLSSLGPPEPPNFAIPLNTRLGLIARASAGGEMTPGVARLTDRRAVPLTSRPHESEPQ